MSEKLPAVREVLAALDADQITEDTAVARLRVLTHPDRLLVGHRGVEWLHADSSIPVREGEAPAWPEPAPLPEDYWESAQ